MLDLVFISVELLLLGIVLGSDFDTDSEGSGNTAFIIWWLLNAFVLCRFLIMQTKHLLSSMSLRYEES